MFLKLRKLAWIQVQSKADFEKIKILMKVDDQESKLIWEKEKIARLNFLPKSDWLVIFEDIQELEVGMFKADWLI